MGAPDAAALQTTAAGYVSAPGYKRTKWGCSEVYTDFTRDETGVFKWALPTVLPPRHNNYGVLVQFNFGATIV